MHLWYIIISIIFGFIALEIDEFYNLNTVIINFQYYINDIIKPFNKKKDQRKKNAKLSFNNFSYYLYFQCERARAHTYINNIYFLSNNKTLEWMSMADFKKKCIET